MSTNKILSDIYFDINNPGSFGGVHKLFVEAKKILPYITLKEVKEWVKNELTYSLHKQARKHFQRNKILVQRRLEQFEIDLVDRQKDSHFNKGYKYILTIIDCFSKYMYAFPIKNKNSDEIVNALKKLFLVAKPDKIRSDRGLEFTNNKVQNLLKKNDIKFFTSNDSKIKCAIIERANQTIIKRMERYFTKFGTRSYINKDLLKNLINSYNKSYHRTIKMAPINVTDDNRQEVFENIYKVKSFKDMFFQKYKTKPIKNETNVRIKYDLNDKMDKSYYPLWSDRIYKISDTIKRPFKPNYKLKLDGQTLKRAFYPEEIQVVGNDQQLMYRVEKILHKRKQNGIDQVLVKWIGYPNEYNLWIPKTNLITLNK